jgi:hypothetical protein
VSILTGHTQEQSAMPQSAGRTISLVPRSKHEESKTLPSKSHLVPKITKIILDNNLTPVPDLALILFTLYKY